MSDYELARRIGVSKMAISLWRSRGRVSYRHVLAVERETGISRHVLRPDLYGEKPCQ